MVAGRYYRIINGHSPLYLNLLSLPSTVAFVIAKTGKYHILGLKKPFLEEGYVEAVVGLYQDSIKALNYLAEEAEKRKISRYYKHLDLHTFTQLTLSEESFHLEMIENWFPEIETILSKESFPVCQFKVFFGILHGAEKKRITYTIEKSSEIVESFGLSSLLYGKIIMTDHLMGRHCAVYNPGSDLIRLARKTAYTKNYNHSSINSLVHELGHRALEIKFVDEYLCETKYNEVIKNDLKQWIPSPYSRNHKEWFPEIFSHGLVKGNELYKKFIREVWV